MLLTSCAKAPMQESPDRLSFFALDTVITLEGMGSGAAQALRDVQESITAMEQDLSRTRPDSIISQVNSSGGEPVTLTPQIYGLLEQAIEVSTLTDGAFDMTIAPAADLWGFTKDAFRVPDEQELAKVKGKVGPQHVHLTDSTVRLDEGAALDLGGIAKGYALEQAGGIFRSYGLSGGLANLGGDVLAYGANRHHQPWNIAIRDPNAKETGLPYFGVLSVSDQYILTSGGYERYFEAGGKTYQHIIDPKTCAPAESTLQSVTVITDLEDGSAVYADALATALYIMGAEDAADFWRDCAFPFEMVLVDASGTVYFTEGLQDCFTPNSDSGYTYRFLH